MRFHFVSRIHDICGQTIYGRVEFSSGEPWRYNINNGPVCISSSVISEAIGQLVSWLAIRDNNFTGRPVFLFANRIEIHNAFVAPGHVDLEATITERDQDTFIFSGKASVGGQVIVQVSDCGGYYMPLSELENPVETRERFLELCTTGRSFNPPGSQVMSRQLIDSVIRMDAKSSITVSKYLNLQEPFFADHFPRFPVTPIVVINEMISAATNQMMESTKDDAGKWLPTHVQDLKIKSFLKPGDTAEIYVKVTETYRDRMETVAEINVSGKRILRGRYGFHYQI